MSGPPTSLPEEVVARHYRTGQPWLLTFEGLALRRLAPAPRTLSTDLILAPGLFDIQVNGFGGVDFNSPDPRPADVLAATRALACHGVTRYLPTVITGPTEVMRRCLTTLADAVARYPEVRRAVPGFHVEGPYLSDREGARGAHDPQCMRPPDEAHFALLQEEAGGLIRHVTLAPELPGAAQFIRRRAAEGLVVALGHTTASPQEIEAAVAAGAQLSTHLGNGCEALLPRHVNPVTVQLGHDSLWASFIPDGHHLPPYLLKSFLRAKGIERSILTTDCMAAAGAPGGRYRLGRLELEVGADRVVRQPGQTNFAGSALTLDRGVANVAQWTGLALADALDMASLHPLRLFGLTTADFPTPDGHLILATTSPSFTLTAVVCGGQRML